MSYRPAGTLTDPEIQRELEAIAREFAELPSMQIRYREPFKPREGNYCVCDGTTWNPLGDGIKRPIIFLNGAWEAF